MLVLGIETSCDETGVAIYDTEQGLLADAIYSQIDIHAEYGGVVPELASSHFLVQRMGFGAASELALTGRFMDGEEAAASGLANRVVDDADLMATAMELANTIAANPDRHLAWTKELLTQNGSETDLELVQAREQARLQEAYESAEHKEAVDAFLNKRKPVFR